MSMKAIIYHNPQCSKSRESRALLSDSDCVVEEICYLKNPPTESELAQLCGAMQIAPFELIRQGEALFKTLNLTQINPKNNPAWLKIMVNNPILIERPIVKIGDQVIIGRPPEKVKALLLKMQFGL